VMEEGTSILVYGKRISMMDMLFKTGTPSDYAVGHIHSYGNGEFTIESFAQGETSFKIENVERVMILAGTP